MGSLCLPSAWISASSGREAAGVENSVGRDLRHRWTDVPPTA